MKRIIKSLYVLLLIMVFLGLFSAKTTVAAEKYSLSLTGKMKVVELPSGTYAEGTNLKPTLKKSKNGNYTLTMYDGSVVNLGIKKSNKKLCVVQVSKEKNIGIYENSNGVLTVQVSGKGIEFDELGTDSYEETVTIQMMNLSIDDRDTLWKKYGPKVKLKIIVKKCPKELWEVKEEEALKEINASQYTTDYEKVKAVYDWITANIEYDFSYKVHSWREALIQKKSVCQGYAELFGVLCRDIGIDSMYVSGIADGLGGWGSHAWNIVKINKKWYLVDATWDANGIGYPTDYQWFLKSEKDFPDHKVSNGYLEEYKNIAKDSYDIPVTTWTDYARRLLEVERKYYENEVETLSRGFDWWLQAKIEEYNEKLEDLTQDEMIEYKDWYESECKEYSVDFLEWLGYCSEEAFIEYEAIYLIYDSYEERKGPLEEFYQKYPMCLDDGM